MGRDWPPIEARLRREIGEFTVSMTGAPGEATSIARKALLEGCDLIVAVGGDGTNNEVVNGFFLDGSPVNPGAAFGILQRGTGGDFKRTLGLRGDLDEYVAALRGDAVRPIDLGRLTFVDHHGKQAVRYFLNIASFGISGVVDNYVNRSHLFKGRLAFFVASLRAGIVYKNQLVRLRIDDGPELERRVNTVAVANGRYFGGSMMVAPQAELDDGLFDVVTLGDLTFGDMLALSRRIYQGTHLEMRKVEHVQARRVVAESDEVVLLDVDGEQPGRLPATFELIPAALRLKVASPA
jgi:YegS/Rv2252/BmrU family lipid kinase